MKTEKAINRATQFSKDLRKALTGKRVLRQRLGIDYWKENWSVPASRETIDVVGLRNDKPRILIEVELLREDPASNVAKVWRSIEDGKIPKNVVIVQAFSKHYRQSKKPRKQRALFIAGKMKESCPKVGTLPKTSDMNQDNVERLAVVPDRSARTTWDAQSPKHWSARCEPRRANLACPKLRLALQKGRVLSQFRPHGQPS